MKDYKQHVHYDTSGLSLDDKVRMCRAAYALCYKWWVDVLSHSNSWQRQKIEMSFDEVMAHLSETAHFTVIHRNRKWIGERDCLEVGFCTLSSPEYFLWMEVAVEYEYVFVKDLPVLC